MQGPSFRMLKGRGEEKKLGSQTRKKLGFGHMQLRETWGRRSWGEWKVQEQVKGQVREMNTRGLTHYSNSLLPV